MSKPDIFSNAAQSQNASGNGAQGYCPQCKCLRNLVQKKRLENFEVKEIYSACCVCGARIIPQVSENKTKSQEESSRTQWDSLFGEKSQTSRKAVLPEMDLSGVHLCKDCAQYLFHPFRSRCCLHDKEVEPTGDCPQFQPKPKHAKF